MATVLVLADIEPAPGPADALAARVNAAISALEPVPPLTLIAHGSLALLLPSVALSQRSNHRTVERYVLVEPQLPTVTDSWPDAPVTLISDDEWLVMQARLRGWEVESPGSAERPDED